MLAEPFNMHTNEPCRRTLKDPREQRGRKQTGAQERRIAIRLKYQQGSNRVLIYGSKKALHSTARLNICSEPTKWFSELQEWFYFTVASCKPF